MLALVACVLAALPSRRTPLSRIAGDASRASRIHPAEVIGHYGPGYLRPEPCPAVKRTAGARKHGGHTKEKVRECTAPSSSHSTGVFRAEPRVLAARACPRRPHVRRGDRILQRTSRHNWDMRAATGSRAIRECRTRDSFFALLAPVRDQGMRAGRFADRLRDDMSRSGHVPFTYEDVRYVPALLCPCLPLAWRRRRRPRPRYRDEKLNRLVCDANAQYVVLVWMALRRHGDRAWASEHLESVQRALRWYDRRRDARGLAHEQPFGSWEDSLLLGGPVAFTNVLYCLAVACARETFPETQDWPVATPDAVLDLVLEPDKIGGVDTVSLAMVALWGRRMGVGEEGMARVDAALREAYGRITPGQAVPNHSRIVPRDRIFFPLRVIGQGAYHAEWRWAWVGCLFASALARRGMVHEARACLGVYARAVRAFGTLHEATSPPGRRGCTGPRDSKELDAPSTRCGPGEKRQADATLLLLDRRTCTCRPRGRWVCRRFGHDADGTFNRGVRCTSSSRLRRLRAAFWSSVRQRDRWPQRS